MILIIGILAAVAIPAFLSQKGKGQDANVKSDINSAQTAEESYSTNSNAPGYTSADNSAAPTSYANLVGVEPTLKGAITGSEGLSRSTRPWRPAPTSSVPPAPEARTSSTPRRPLASSSPLVKYTDGTVQRTCSVTGSNVSGCNAAAGATQGSW